MRIKILIIMILVLLVACNSQNEVASETKVKDYVDVKTDAKDDAVDDIKDDLPIDIIEDTKENGGIEMDSKVVLLKTNLGDIKIELADDMPITAGNFEKLVKEGFYDGIIFHRIIDGFMIQGGDPTGTGSGDPGYKIKDEFSANNKNDRGTLSMANAGPNTGGSQFFINLANNNFLDGKHPVFGKVIDGMDVVDKMAKVKVGPGDRPVEEVKIIKASLV